MGRFLEPELVVVAPEPACATSALLVACGSPAPPTCPEDLASIDATTLLACAPSRRVLVALTQATEREGIPPVLAAVLLRFAARLDEVTDPIDRLLLAELLRRDSRYEAAVTLAGRLLDDTATDPAIRTLAFERLVAMLGYEDWNEDQVDDPEVASHVTPPLLPDRPWALALARRVLERFRCDESRARVVEALRARFGQPETWPLEWSWPHERREGEGDWDGLDPRVLGHLVRSQPFACAPEASSAVGAVRVLADGTYRAEATSSCVDAALDRLPPLRSVFMNGWLESSFVFVFAAPR